MKIALITGITGQDGSYLAEFLIEKGYEVHGVVRRASLINTYRIDAFFDKIKLHYGDLTDATNIIGVIQKVQPDEIYNLGAQSHVKVSFETPEYTGQVDGLGTLRILEAVRLLGMEKKTRIYQASTSEMFGKVQETPQKETTSLNKSGSALSFILELCFAKISANSLKCFFVISSFLYSPNYIG